MTDASAIVQEPLLEDNPNRFVILPLQYHDIWDSYLRQKGAIWDINELDFAQDYYDWVEKLNDNERYFISHVLAFFAASDGIVLENLVVNFMKEIQIPEVRCAYGFQTFMENIHSEVYATLIDTLIKDPEEKHRLFNALETIPVVKKKAEWALKWIGNLNECYFTDIPESAQKVLLTAQAHCDPSTLKWINHRKRPLAERLIAFAAVEGIFFSGSFCAIFWLKERDDVEGTLMPGLIQSNDLISRDEGMHQDFAALLYKKYIKNKLPESRVHQIIKEAVEIETEFITEAIPCKLINMNADAMIQYIQFVADQLLIDLGVTSIYNKENPFDFMENQGQDKKGSFFERRTTEYQKANVLGENKEVRFDLDNF